MRKLFLLSLIFILIPFTNVYSRTKDYRSNDNVKLLSHFDKVKKSKHHDEKNVCFKINNHNKRLVYENQKNNNCKKPHKISENIEETILFGPVKYQRKNGKKTIYNNNFEIKNITEKNILIIHNGDSDGNNKVSSAEIYLNNIKIVNQKYFKNKSNKIQLPIYLKEINEIKVLIFGKPGSYITLEIRGDLIEPVNENPIAILKLDKLDNFSTLEVNFDFSESYDPDGEITLFELDYEGDGTYDWSSEKESSTIYNYSNAGLYNPVLRITDNNGAKTEYRLEDDTIIIPKQYFSKTDKNGSIIEYKEPSHELYKLKVEVLPDTFDYEIDLTVKIDKTSQLDNKNYNPVSKLYDFKFFEKSDFRRPVLITIPYDESQFLIGRTAQDLFIIQTLDDGTQTRLNNRNILEVDELNKTITFQTYHFSGAQVVQEGDIKIGENYFDVTQAKWYREGIDLIEIMGENDKLLSRILSVQSEGGEYPTKLATSRIELFKKISTLSEAGSFFLNTLSVLDEFEIPVTSYFHIISSVIDIGKVLSIENYTDEEGSTILLESFLNTVCHGTKLTLQLTGNSSIANPIGLCMWAATKILVLGINDFSAAIGINKDVIALKQKFISGFTVPVGQMNGMSSTTEPINLTNYEYIDLIKNRQGLTTDIPRYPNNPLFNYIEWTKTRNTLYGDLKVDILSNIFKKRISSNEYIFALGYLELQALLSNQDIYGWFDKVDHTMVVIRSNNACYIDIINNLQIFDKGGVSFVELPEGLSNKDTVDMTIYCYEDVFGRLIETYSSPTFTTKIYDPDLELLSISSSPSYLNVGDSSQIKITGNLGNKSINISPEECEFSIIEFNSKEAPLSINSNGVVTGIRQGQAKIRIQYGDKNTQVLVLVTNQTLQNLNLESININNTFPEINENIVITANVINNGLVDITNQATINFKIRDNTGAENIVSQQILKFLSRNVGKTFYFNWNPPKEGIYQVEVEINLVEEINTGDNKKIKIVSVGKNTAINVNGLTEPNDIILNMPPASSMQSFFALKNISNIPLSLNIDFNNTTYLEIDNVTDRDFVLKPGEVKSFRFEATLSSNATQATIGNIQITYSSPITSGIILQPVAVNPVTVKTGVPIKLGIPNGRIDESFSYITTIDLRPYKTLISNGISYAKVKFTPDSIISPTFQTSLSVFLGNYLWIADSINIIEKNEWFSDQIGQEISVSLRTGFLTDEDYFTVYIGSSHGETYNIRNAYLEFLAFEGEPNLIVNKFVDKHKVNIGDKVRFDLEVYNTGSNVADVVVFDDSLTLPQGTTESGGYISDEIRKLDPKSKETDLFYFVSFLEPGKYIFPPSNITYENVSGSVTYKSTSNPVEVEVWGGKLNVLAEISNVKIDRLESLNITANVINNLNNEVKDALVVASIIRPDHTLVDHILFYDESSNFYKGSYTDTKIPGDYHIKVHATKDLYEKGDTNSVLSFNVYSELADTDLDGYLNIEDRYPFDPTEWFDSDLDGIGDNKDEDDDNDGMPDSWEEMFGLNSLVNDALSDFDNDGIINLKEFLFGLNPDMNDGNLDYDGDKLSNALEIGLGTNLKKIDTDQDGLSDYSEIYEFNTDPLTKNYVKWKEITSKDEIVVNGIALTPNSLIADDKGNTYIAYLEYSDDGVDEIYNNCVYSLIITKKTIEGVSIQKIVEFNNEYCQFGP